MLHDAADNPGSLSPATLREAYEAELRAAIGERDAETVAAETGVDAAAVSRLAGGGDVPDLSVDDAAAVMAVDEDVGDAETVLALLRDHMMMAMATAVVDVDTVAANIDHDLTGQEVQQALEGRASMTLAQLASIQQFVAERGS
ncbi:MAG: DUF5791 family protein [Haloferacaceae archaeon]